MSSSDPLSPSERSRIAAHPPAVTATVDLDFTSHLSLRDLHLHLATAAAEIRPGAHLTYLTRDPDSAPGTWSGTRHPEHDAEFHRPWRVHVELLRVFGFEMRTPDPVAETDIVRVIARRAEPGASGPVTLPPEEIEARYGSDSAYREFDRLEEPEILDDLLHAARRIDRKPNEKLLAIGCNDGHELEVFAGDSAAGCIGIDFSASAIERARSRFPEAEFHARDIAEIGEVVAGPVDVAIALNVLQCRTVDRDAVLAWIVRNTHAGSRILLSIPNCHRGRSDILRRPLDRSDRRHDRSLVFKDARHFARVLHRSGERRVEIFGTYDVFVLATPEGGSPATSE